jgi:hypothetical protein
MNNIFWKFQVKAFKDACRQRVPHFFLVENGLYINVGLILPFFGQKMSFCRTKNVRVNMRNVKLNCILSDFQMVCFRQRPLAVIIHKTFQSGPPAGIIHVFLFLFFICKCNLIRQKAFLVRHFEYLV